MRSRYAAFVLHNADYLLQTWHASSRPSRSELEFDSNMKWRDLRIVKTDSAAGDSAKATVEFIARYKLNGKAYKLHELSRFVRENEQWYYVNGDLIP